METEHDTVLSMTEPKEIRTRLLNLFAALALSSISVFGQDVAPPLASSPPSNLELHLRPGILQNGVPEAFIFEIVNISAQDVRVPKPSIECGSGYSGSIWITLRFIPLHPTGSGTGFGCAAEWDHWPPILERAQEWTLLHPAESLREVVTSDALHYTGDQPGSYEFWANYTPPSISLDDQNRLLRSDIDFPHEPLTTAHLKFKREQ